MGRRRSSVVWRVVLALLAVVVLLPVLAVAGALVFVDPNAWRPRIEAAALQATGRALTLGRLSLVPALSPTVAAEDVALANLPGGSRPAMATVARAEVTLALLPLVLGRVEVARVVLLRPDVLLERDDRGTPNWRFARAEAPAGTASPDAGTGRTGGGWSEILVRSLRIEDGRVVWRDRGTGAATTVAIRQLDAGAPDWTAPVTLTGQGSVQRGAAPEALVLTAETGPLARLLDAAAATPWPVNATLEAPGARLTMNGTATRPLEGRGIAATVAGAAVSLSALDGLLQTRLPALRQVGFTGRVDDAGGGAPRLSALALRAGASDLDALVPGLQVARAELSAAGLDQPMQAEAEGTLAGAPLHLTAALGPPASLLWAAPGPFPVDIAAQALGGTITLKGALAAPAALAGVDLAVAARLPDLAALSPLVGRPLPALGPVALDARVGDRDGGGIGQGLAIHGLAVTTPAGDLAGDGAVGFGARPSVQATLSSRRIDADAIAAVPGPAAGCGDAAGARDRAGPAHPGCEASLRGSGAVRCRAAAGGGGAAEWRRHHQRLCRHRRAA
jgi:AsmA protein